MSDKFFNVAGQLYTQNQYLAVDQRCNAVMVVNRGDGVLFINGIPLAPSPLGPGNAGESITLGGNAGEYYRGMLELVFTPGTANPAAVIVQKFYIQ